MSLLYYWRPDNYERDRRFGFGYHLNQNSPQIASAQPGESVWAFTRRKRDGLYVLAAELVVRALTRNPPNYRYGRYRVWGDLEASRYFDLDIAPSSWSGPYISAPRASTSARRSKDTPRFVCSPTRTTSCWQGSPATFLP